MKLHYRTVFLSDLHLGAAGCQAEDIAWLLKRIRCDKLYLVGDIIDMWRLKSRWHWPAAHNTVIQRILKHAKRGTQVIYIPGNHDEYARQYVGIEFGGVDIRIKDIHTTADGRRLLITHGDQFDLIVKHHPVLSAMGGVAYEWLMRLNRWYNKGRAFFGYPYWSLSHFIKLKVKRACTFISRFEETLVEEAQRHDLDGVVCGHIHKAECRLDEAVAYYNCGDWVESCSMLVEHEDGSMEILDGLELVAQLREAKKTRSEQPTEPVGPAGAVLDDDEDEAPFDTEQLLTAPLAWSEP